MLGITKKMSRSIDSCNILIGPARLPEFRLILNKKISDDISDNVDDLIILGDFYVFARTGKSTTFSIICLICLLFSYLITSFINTSSFELIPVVFFLAIVFILFLIWWQYRKINIIIYDRIQMYYKKLRERIKTLDS